MFWARKWLFAKIPPPRLVRPSMTLTVTLLKDDQDLLTSVETVSAKVCLFLNSRKTEYMTIHEEADHLPILSNNGSQLNEVKDFKYLGFYVADSMKDFMIRKGQAWDACNRLQLIWKSNIPRSKKLAIFRACVESILLQWNLVIMRSDITKSSYNKVSLLVPALYISLFFCPDIMRNRI